MQKTNKPQKIRTICSRCIYDDSVPQITFDEEGVCSYCKIHDSMEAEYPTGVEGLEKLKELAEDIKRSGKRKKYDCIVGVSGGCDSSYLLYLAKNKLGLRPLAVHFDNTWNSKIAVENIHKVLKKLDVDLYTYVMDNEEFSDLAQAMLHASIPEIDALTDIALTTVLYMAAEKHGVKYILNGHSFRTEGIAPLGICYCDGKYIQSIHKEFGKQKMKRFPNLWLHKWLIWICKGIKRVRPLYYIQYNKEETKKFLSEEFGWEWYGGHHMENRYTSFANKYYIPTKFKIDYRNVEFSALVRSKQLKRDVAIKLMESPPECPEDIIEEVKNRLCISDEEFKAILSAQTKSAKEYKTYHPTFRRLRPLFWVFLKADLIPKSFYIKYTC